jgi:hypothetical protein
MVALEVASGDAVVISAAVGAVGIMAVVKWMTINRQPEGEEFIEETKVVLLKPVVLDGLTGWHRMPTTNPVVEFLVRQGASSDRSS